MNSECIHLLRTYSLPGTGGERDQVRPCLAELSLQVPFSTEETRKPFIALKPPVQGPDALAVTWSFPFSLAQSVGPGKALG